VHGKAAHSSTPHLGVNAIEKLLGRLPARGVARIEGGTSANTVPAAAQAIVFGQPPADDTEIAASHVDGAVDLGPAIAVMQNLWREWIALAAALEPKHDTLFSPDHVVNNLGVVASEGGGVVAQFDARLLPEHDPQRLMSAFAEQARAHVPGSLRLELEVLRDNPGMRAQPDSPLLTALADVLRAEGLPGEPRAKPTSTEAGVFARAGVHAAVFGPGVSTGNAHTANEWNRTADLERAISIYAALVRRLCVTP
jgi:acetylornithine deacetylase/succinyl-diaminopimelate desuccinylase-like protein